MLLCASVLNCIICKWRISLSGTDIISQNQRNTPFAQEASEEPEIKLSASFRRKLSVGIISFWLPVTGVESGKAAFRQPRPRTKEYCGCW